MLCEGTAVVLDVVQPKAQLVLAACDSEWGRGARHQERERSPARDARSRAHRHRHACVCGYTRMCLCIHARTRAEAHTCAETRRVLQMRDQRESPQPQGRDTRGGPPLPSWPRGQKGHPPRRPKGQLAENQGGHSYNLLEGSSRTSSTEGGRGHLPQGREGSVSVNAGRPAPRVPEAVRAGTAAREGAWGRGPRGAAPTPQPQTPRSTRPSLCPGALPQACSPATSCPSSAS